MVSRVSHFLSSRLLIVYRIIYATESCTHTFHSKEGTEFGDFKFEDKGTKLIHFSFRKEYLAIWNINTLLCS